jgi:hypothetical protein
MTSSDITTNLTAIASIFATVSAAAIWIGTKVSRKRTDEIISATTGAIQKFIASQMTNAIEGRDPKSYYTLDLLFAGGETLRVPMIPGVALTALENIAITVTAHCKSHTIATLVCKGFGHIPSHAHASHHEDIRVISGMMTCLTTGKIYKENDVWTIPPGEFHAATFHDCVLIIRYHPPLLTAHERPVDLTAMDQVFPLA